MNTNKMLYVTFIAGLYIIVSTPAAATYTTVHPGSMCQPYDETTDTITVYSTNGWVFNNSTSIAASFVCPVMRYCDASLTVTSSLTWVSVIDYNDDVGSSYQVHCYFRQTDYDSLSYLWSGEEDTSGSDSDPQRLVFEDQVGNDIFDSYYAGSPIELVCTIPKKDGANVSGVVAYSVGQSCAE